MITNNTAAGIRARRCNKKPSGVHQLLVMMILVFLLSTIQTTQGWITTTVRFSTRNRQRRDIIIMMAQQQEQIVSRIESTPNPSSFLIQLSTPLSGLEDLVGSLRGRTYTAKSAATTPLPVDIERILAIEGIVSVYAMASALTINKKVVAKWDTILPLVLTALGEDDNYQVALLQGLSSSRTAETSSTTTASVGQVQIRLQISNQMPIQIEGTGHRGTTIRKKLAPKFSHFMELLVDGGCDFFSDRQWVDRGVRYYYDDNDDDGIVSDDKGDDGDTTIYYDSGSDQDQEMLELTSVLEAEYEEYDAAYSEERLATIVAKQLGEIDVSPSSNIPTPSSRSSSTTMTVMTLERVHQLCDEAERGDQSALATLTEFVTSFYYTNDNNKNKNKNMAARRNALAFLGGTGADFPGNDAVLDAIVSAFQKDKNPIMRRTAGDAFSDLGDARAIPHAITALQDDRSKLVQWRAARVLGELGTELETVAVLKQASFESSKYDFEVMFEIKDAMRKVRDRAMNDNKKDDDNTAGIATGPMWKQIQDGLVGKNPPPSV